MSASHVSILLAAILHGSAPNGWKLGDGWHLRMDWPAHVVESKTGSSPGEVSKKQSEERKPAAYDIHAVCLGPAKVGKFDCMKVEFIIPPNTAPNGITYRWHVSIDPKDGWPRRAYSYRDYRDVPLAKFGEARFIMAMPEGYPVELFPLAPFEGKEGDMTLTVKGPDADGRYVATVRKGEETVLEIRQIWKDGDLWWREYERYRNGKLDLRAKFVPRVVAVAPPKQSPPAAPPPPPPTTVKAKPPAFQDLTNDPLRADPRLAVKISCELRNPRAQHMLDYLMKATGLSFELADNVDQERVVYHFINWPEIPAWEFMHMIAKSNGLPGTWEKTELGYRFVASTPRVEPQPVASTEKNDPATSAPVAETPAAGDGWLLRIGFMAIGGAITLMTAYAVRKLPFRRRVSIGPSSERPHEAKLA